jgi:Secretion system C-terminal sorting domain
MAVNHIANAFPSPASTSVRLDIDVPTAVEVSALIVSMNGQTIKSRNFGNLQAGKQQINVDVMDLATGTFQVILKSDKGKLGTQKIVVSH